MRFRAFVAATVPALLRDGIALTGAAAITYGAWMLSQPAGFIVGGAFMICIAALTARRSA